MWQHSNELLPTLIHTFRLLHPLVTGDEDDLCSEVGDQLWILLLSRWCGVGSGSMVTYSLHVGCRTGNPGLSQWMRHGGVRILQIPVKAYSVFSVVCVSVSGYCWYHCWWTIHLAWRAKPRADLAILYPWGNFVIRSTVNSEPCLTWPKSDLDFKSRTPRGWEQPEC